MKIYRFPQGGLTFEDRSAPPAQKSVLAFLPNISVVPLKQNSGAPAAPVTGTGRRIREGELLARSQGAGGANVHAPVPGEIVRTTSWRISDGLTSEPAGGLPPAVEPAAPAVETGADVPTPASALAAAPAALSEEKNDAFVIKFQGSFEILGKTERRFDWHDAPPFELRKAINDGGIIEMTGNGRPLRDLFTEKMAAGGTRTLVAACVFDDPWLVADLVLCKERAEAVAEGAWIAARAAEAAGVIIAISQNHLDTGRAIYEAALHIDERTALVPVSARYPQRGMRELEMALRAYERTESIDLGSLVTIGAATTAAVYDAVALKKPLVSRYVAVGGSAVKKPSIIHTRIGTRIGELFDQCGGFKKEPAQIGMGSRLIGRAAASLEEPVTKATFAVFADQRSFFPLSNRVLRRLPAAPAGGSAGGAGSSTGTENACINCGMCRSVCPAGLDPNGLYNQIRVGRSNERFSYLAAECDSCACCEIVCPSHLPLCTIIKRGIAGGGK